ncbi:MAG: hypothetical protein U0736_05885 [Gemmataceae bacterium]
MASTPLNLGFLTILHEGNGYLGGYLVTNAWGRPLEFRLSSAVQPNKVQQILYAATLVPYICGDLIGKALVDKAAVPVGFVLTTCEQAIDLRHKVDCPVVWVVEPTHPRAGEECAVPLPHGRGALLCHPKYPADVQAVRDLLGGLDGIPDLTEPFARVKEAIAEARKLGVTGGRAAA